MEIESNKYISNIQFSKQEFDDFFKSNKVTYCYDENYVPLKMLSAIIGRDKSNVLRILKKGKYKVIKKVIEGSGGQLACVVSKETAMQILKDREEKGYVINFLHKGE